MNYSYSMMTRAIQGICSNVEASKIKFDYVVGLSRGGLIPAVRLSHCLNLELVPLRWSLRDHGTRDVSELSNILRDLSDDKKILMVDDLIDSGESIKVMMDQMSRMRGDLQLNLFDKTWEHNLSFAVLLFNTDQKKVRRPRFAYENFSRKERPEWINFWWEAKAA